MLRIPLDGLQSIRLHIRAGEPVSSCYYLQGTVYLSHRDFMHSPWHFLHSITMPKPRSPRVMTKNVSYSLPLDPLNTSPQVSITGNGPLVQLPDSRDPQMQHSTQN